MSAIEVTSVSTKGQVVIPQSVRTDLGIKSGDKLLVMSDGENVLLKPLVAPRLDSFQQLITASRTYAKGVGLKKSDVATAIRKARRAHRR